MTEEQLLVIVAAIFYRTANYPSGMTPALAAQLAQTFITTIRGTSFTPSQTQERR